VGIMPKKTKLTRALFLSFKSSNHPPSSATSILTCRTAQETFKMQHALRLCMESKTLPFYQMLLETMGLHNDKILLAKRNTFRLITRTLMALLDSYATILKLPQIELIQRFLHPRVILVTMVLSQ
jgi:hypothetical protein